MSTTALLRAAPDAIAAAARRVMARCDELARVSAATMVSVAEGSIWRRIIGRNV